MQNRAFTYKEYANLIDSMVEQVGVSHQSFELLLYVWQMLAGGVHHYMSHRSTLRIILTHFLSESVITAVNEFICEYECRTVQFLRLQSHGSKVLCSSNTCLANWYTSGAKISFLDYTDSLMTFCQHTSQSFSTTPLETSYDRDKRMIDMMTVRDTMISFSLINDMLTGDQKMRLKVLVLFKRTFYKLSRMTTTYTEIWTRPQEFTNWTVILNVRCQQYS
jgi:hypothetical protein